jgi:hypothetical protein
VNFVNYADFRDQFHVMFDGDDISDSDISGNVLDLIIAAGEQRIYRDLRSSVQESSLSLTTVGNLAPLPADFLEMKGSPYIGNNKATANFMPWQQLQDRLQLNVASLSAAPEFYSFQSDHMIFYPAQGDGTVVIGTYYKRFADISTGLNALFIRHPDVFLYGSLAECAPFLGEMSRLPIWEQKYTSLVQEANEQERRRITRGSKLQTRIA